MSFLTSSSDPAIRGAFRSSKYQLLPVVQPPIALRGRRGRLSIRPTCSGRATPTLRPRPRSRLHTAVAPSCATRRELLLQRADPTVALPCRRAVAAPHHRDYLRSRPSLLALLSWVARLGRIRDRHVLGLLFVRFDRTSARAAEIGSFKRSNCARRWRILTTTPYFARSRQVLLRVRTDYFGRRRRREPARSPSDRARGPPFVPAPGRSARSRALA